MSINYQQRTTLKRFLNSSLLVDRRVSQVNLELAIYYRLVDRLVMLRFEKSQLKGNLIRFPLYEDIVPGWNIVSYRNNGKAISYSFYPDSTLNDWRGWNSTSARRLQHRRVITRLLLSHYINRRILDAEL